MSTRQSYSYRRAGASFLQQAEIARRQIRLAQERAAAAAAAQRREMERLRAERARLEAITRAADQGRQRVDRRVAETAAVHRRAGQHLASQANELRAVASEAAANRRALDHLEQSLARSRAELFRAETELRAEIDRITCLDAEIAAETVGLTAAIASAHQSLNEIAGLADAAIESLGEMSPAELEELRNEQMELEASVRQLETEVRFLTADAAIATPALVTLLAMEANGYRLRDTLTHEGLVSYFEREGERHRLAVRAAPVARAGESSEQWNVVAETFGMVGEGCLSEIEDFETAVEELEVGILVPEDRIYPKDQRGGARVLGGLPRPPLAVREPRAASEKRRRERGH